MKKIILYIFIVISIFLIIGIFHDEYGKIFGKIILFWALFIAVYSLILNKKIIYGKKKE
jgi:hypothetical protein